MRHVYISGPYRPHGERIGDRISFVQARLQAATEAATLLRDLRLGYYSPHGNTGLLGLEPGFDDYWAESDRHWLEHSDALLTLPDWEASEGSVFEVGWMLENRRPVFHYPKHPRYMGVDNIGELRANLVAWASREDPDWFKAKIGSDAAAHAF